MLERNQSQMIKPVLVGIGLSAATILIHGVGTLGWVALIRKWYILPRVTEEKPKVSFDDFDYRRGMFILTFTTTLLVCLHVLEVSIWGFAYLMLPTGELLDTLEESMYFSTVTFTSLGYGDVVLDGSWRILSGIEAMAGILVFGWSSALLLTTFMKMLESSKFLKELD